jgi:hypothetical protein
MNAIKKVRRYLIRNSDAPSSQVLRRLTTALGEEREFPIFELYEMDLEAFELAVELLQDWRLDRYYASRIRLFDTVLADVPADPPPAAAQASASLQ